MTKREARAIEGLESMKVDYEKGTITEVGASEFDNASRLYSHFLIQREDGKVVKVTNAMAESGVSPNISVGSSGCFAIVGRRTMFGLGPRKNGVVGFGNEAGFVTANMPRLAALVFVVPLLLLFSAMMVLALLGGAVVGIILLPFVLLLLWVLRIFFRVRSLIAKVQRDFAAMGMIDNTAKVY